MSPRSADSKTPQARSTRNGVQSVPSAPFKTPISVLVTHDHPPLTSGPTPNIYSGVSVQTVNVMNGPGDNDKVSAHLKPLSAFTGLGVT